MDKKTNLNKGGIMAGGNRFIDRFLLPAAGLTLAMTPLFAALSLKDAFQTPAAEPPTHTTLEIEQQDHDKSPLKKTDLSTGVPYRAEGDDKGGYSKAVWRIRYVKNPVLTLT